MFADLIGKYEIIYKGIVQQLLIKQEETSNVFV